MFSNLLFLILVLMLVNIATEVTAAAWIIGPVPAFLISIGAYAVLLGMIYLQNKWARKGLGGRTHWPVSLVNLELLAYLALFLLILGGQRLLQSIPILGLFDTWISIVALFLYFFALFIYHYTDQKKSFNRLEQSLQPIRLIAPFAIPFLLFTFILDILHLIPSSTLHELFFSSTDSATGSIILFIASLVFMGLMLIFLPPIIVWAWKCRPMEDSPLKTRLENLCSRAHFKHAGMMTWTILNNTLTAAILGVVPRLRYVIFTKRLLNELSPEAIEAILAHEIGHSYRKHLIIFPVVIFGMVASIGIFSLLFSDTINQWFEMQMIQYPSEYWSLMYPLAIFIPYALIIGLYFRFIFGLFSRLFERQADLHGFDLQINPDHMIEALDVVAIATGFTHMTPNWHHYSIQERMDFLRKAKDNPRVIQEHHRRTYRTLGIYLACLACVTIFLIAPVMPDIFPFKQAGALAKKISTAIAHQFINKKN